MHKRMNTAFRVSVRSEVTPRAYPLGSASLFDEWLDAGLLINVLPPNTSVLTHIKVASRTEQLALILSRLNAKCTNVSAKQNRFWCRRKESRPL